MSAAASVDDLVEALEMLSDETRVFLDRRTGKPVPLSYEDIAILEGESTREIPDWQMEAIESVRESYESEDLIELPSRFDIDEWSMLRDFASAQADAGPREALQRAIHGAGAFRRFKSTCDRLGLLETWYRYREQAYAALVRDWLEVQGIPIQGE